MTDSLVHRRAPYWIGHRDGLFTSGGNFTKKFVEVISRIVKPDGDTSPWIQPRRRLNRPGKFLIGVFDFSYEHAFHRTMADYYHLFVLAEPDDLGHDAFGPLT